MQTVQRSQASLVDMMRSDVLHNIATALASRALEQPPPPATGDQPYPYSRLQQIGFFILFFFNALALFVYALRMYGRISSKQFGWDDVLISLAMAVSVAETGCSYKSMKTAYIGVHLKDIPPNANMVLAQKWNYIIQILYNPILALVKASVLLFLLRLGGQQKKIRYSIISLLVFNLALMVAIFVAAVCQCQPVNYFWMRVSYPTPKGSCFDQNAFYIWTAGLTIFTDLLVLMLPFWIFLGLKLAMKVRIALIAIFTLGGVVTVMSVLRLSWLIETSNSDFFMKKDPTYDIRFTYSAVETNLAIVTASAPALRPLFVKWFPRVFSSFKSSTNKYSKDRYDRSTDKNSRNNTIARSNHNSTFALKDMRGRSEIRSHSPAESEEEIMTYNGILKTSDIVVAYTNKNEAAHDGRDLAQTPFDYRPDGHS